MTLSRDLLLLLFGLGSGFFLFVASLEGRGKQFTCLDPVFLRAFLLLRGLSLLVIVWAALCLFLFVGEIIILAEPLYQLVFDGN